MLIDQICFTLKDLFKVHYEAKTFTSHIHILSMSNEDITSHSIPEPDRPIESTGNYLTGDTIWERIMSPGENAPLIEWGDHLKREVENTRDLVGPWYCDLHMGYQAFLSTEKHLTNLDWKKDFEIAPGEFGLLITEENVHIPPDLVGFISLRFKIAIKGLINISGRHVDPHYSGKIIFSVYNAGSTPVIIKRGDAIFMISFAKLDRDAPKKKTSNFMDVDSIKPEYMQYVRGPSVSLLALDTKLRALESKISWAFWIMGGVVVGLSVSVIVFFLTHL